MDDRIICADVLHLRVGDATVVLKERRQPAAGDVARLVNRGGEHGAAMFTVPNWIICSAAEERNAKWSAGDNHKLVQIALERAWEYRQMKLSSVEPATIA